VVWGRGINTSKKKNSARHRTPSSAGKAAAAVEGKVTEEEERTV